MRKRPELLAPAGTERAFRTALRFGADAIYLGTAFSLRAKASRFTPEATQRLITEAHALGVRVYQALNIFPFDDDLEPMLSSARRAQELGIDALIVSDIGLVRRLHEALPEMELHVSTQANVTNSDTARVFRDCGAKRIVVARELSLARIRAMHEVLGASVELEAFVHGAMCMAWSGRCMLSRYFNDKSANRGACTQPCRWEYMLAEQGRTDRQLFVAEEARGSAILSAEDLCMLDHLDVLQEAGIVSDKIEGRTKSEIYVATVTGAYRRTMDALATHLPEQELLATLACERDELEKISHRPYSTGFYFGRPQASVSETADMEREYVAYVLESSGGEALVEVKNRFFVGDALETVTPAGSEPLLVEAIREEDGKEAACAPHPRARVWITYKQAHLEAGDLLRGPLRNRAMNAP